DKSLLKQEDAGDEPRFVMLETIREYALEQLEANGETAILRRRYADYYVALAERAAPELIGAQPQVWLGRLAVEHRNLRAVLGWSVSPQGHVELGSRLAIALQWFWIIQSHFGEGYVWLERILALSRQVGSLAAVRAKALRAAGFLASFWSDY